MNISDMLWLSPERIFFLRYNRSKPLPAAVRDKFCTGRSYRSQRGIEIYRKYMPAVPHAWSFQYPESS